MNENTFFVTGGTLPLNASSYVGRQADADLFDALRRGQYCYLLNTRQMGKSSLVVRTAERLRQTIGASVAIFELSAIGQNITPEQLYYGLCNLLGQQLHLEDEFDDFWFDNETLSPMQRFFESIRRVALARLPGPLIIVVDEVDVLRTVQLRFSTDEFFGGIRDCHNRRTTQPEFQRLTFCLVGVATPADLISDTRVSPFNIGQRIVISDFREEEAQGLAVGLGGNGKELLSRVLYWTGGHPHLTQRLCHELVRQGDMSVRDVDRECERLFFSKTARESDDNLTFVRDRLLRSTEHRVEELLDLYSRIRSGKAVYDDDANPLHATLRLSGVVKVADNRGLLVVRNRIYARVFDEDFIRDNMPGAELRRQAAAARRGRLQVGAVAAAVILMLSGLLQYSLNETSRANQAEIDARREASRANKEANNSAAALRRYQRALGDLNAARQQLDQYNRDITVAQRRLDQARHQVGLTREQMADSIAAAERKLNKAKALLKQKEEQVRLAEENAKQLRQDAKIAQTDMEAARKDAREARGIADEERGNARQARQETASAIKIADDARNEAKKVNEAAQLARETMERERSVLIAEKERLSRVIDQQKYIYSIANALSELESNEIDRALRALRPVRTFYDKPKFEWAYLNSLANIPEMKRVMLPVLSGGITSLAFSPGTSSLIASNKSRLYNEQTRQRFDLSPDGTRFRTVAISPTGSFFGTGDNKGRIRLWRINHFSIDEHLPDKAIDGGLSAISALGFSGGDAPLLIAGTTAGRVTVWNQNKRLVKEIVLDKNTRNIIRGVALDTEGKRAIIATDTQVEIYNVATGKRLTVLSDVPSITGAMAFFPGGGKIALTTRDNQLYIFDAATGYWLDAQTIPAEVKDPQTIVFLPQGSKVAIGGSSPDGQIGAVAELPLRDPDPIQQPAAVRSIAFTPDSRSLVLINDRTDSEPRPLVLPKSLDLAPSNLEHARQWGSAVAFSADGQNLAVGTQDGQADLFSTRSAKPATTLKSAVTTSVTTLAFSPDGALLAAGHPNGLVTIWQTATGMPLDFVACTEPVKMLTFTPDSKSLFVGSRHNGIQIFATDGSPQHLFSMETDPGDFHCFALSTNGLTLAVAQGTTIRIYDTATGRSTTCRGHTNTVSCLTFSPDGSRLLSGSRDGSVKLWDVATGQQVLTLRGTRYWNDSGSVTTVAFAPDGMNIAVGTESGKAIVLRGTVDETAK